MILHVIDKGDPSVGINSVTFDIECPFQHNEVEKEDLDFFKINIANAYKEFAQGKIISLYDFELDKNY